VLLNNALRQTGWAGSEVQEDTWRAVVREWLQELPWDHVLSDVRPFVEENAASLLTHENLLRVLR
jgi:hypothetical protein